MVNSPFEPIKINLVEEKGWEKRFGSSESANDAAWEDYINMSADDFESLIDDLWSARDTKKRVSKKRLTSEELEFLADQLKANNEHLEPVKQTITDAMTWMYEAAAQPTDDDIKGAMEMASELISTSMDDTHLWASMVVDEDSRRGPKEWSPRKRYTAEEIRNQLAAQVSYEHEKGHWERYLIFSFWDAKVSQELFSKMRGSPIVYGNMKEEWGLLAKDYIHNFFTHLGDIMDDVDLSDRTDWNRAWKSMLKSGIEPGVREGIREVLKEMPDA